MQVLFVVYNIVLVRAVGTDGREKKRFVEANRQRRTRNVKVGRVEAYMLVGVAVQGALLIRVFAPPFDLNSLDTLGRLEFGVAAEALLQLNHDPLVDSPVVHLDEDHEVDVLVALVEPKVLFAAQMGQRHRVADFPYDRRPVVTQHTALHWFAGCVGLAARAGTPGGFSIDWEPRCWQPMPHHHAPHLVDFERKGINKFFAGGFVWFVDLFHCSEEFLVVAIVVKANGMLAGITPDFRVDVVLWFHFSKSQAIAQHVVIQEHFDNVWSFREGHFMRGCVVFEGCFHG